MRRKRWLVAVVMTVAILVAAGCSTVQSAANPKTWFGFSNGGDFDWEPSAAMTRDFADMAAVGSSWVRLDPDWNAVQAQGPNFWNWSNTDRIVAAAQQAHQQILLQLSYSPPWARRAACASQLQCAPQNPNDFARFASAVAHRYAPTGVHHYEIWNEPNLQQWWGTPPNAADYTNLLKPTYVALHQADPQAVVVTGGTAPNGDLGAQPDNPSHPVNWLTALYAAGARGYFDAVGHHPYPIFGHAPLACCVNWNAFTETPWLHQIMADHGDGAKQVWGTEFGIPTSATVDGPTQAAWMTQAVNQWNTWHTQGQVGPLFLMELRDGSDYSGQYFGIETENWVKKPAYQTLASLLVG